MRRVLVTGGGSGIGRAVARAMAEAGDAVTISGRTVAPLEQTAKGYDMICRTADVTEEASVAALFDAPYDVVIANAGMGVPALVKNITLADWNAQLAVNLTGTFLTFREALNGMQSGGRLIAVASSASLMGQANVAAYTAAKHGVLGLVRSLAQEVAKEGITCNAVCPYFVDTPLTDQSAQGLSKRLGISEDEARSLLAKRNPVGRLISVDEVASAVLYLASPGASMVNGHALSVSGGLV